MVLAWRHWPSKEEITFRGRRPGPLPPDGRCRPCGHEFGEVRSRSQSLRADVGKPWYRSTTSKMGDGISGCFVGDCHLFQSVGWRPMGWWTVPESSFKLPYTTA